jgi:cytochrome b subunit of formate dehydrogenase
MYQKISIIAILITLVGIALHRLASSSKKKRQRKSTKKLSVVGVLRILVYLLAMLSFVVLAVTGFYPTLVLGRHISGYTVMVHATFAPVFAICLAVLAVMWAHSCRFAYSDWPWFQRIVQRLTLVKSAGEQAHCESSSLGQKITFWLIIFLAMPLILSIVLIMLPLFGTHWQECLISTHRWTALVFTLVVIVHTYLLIRTIMQE